MTYARINPDRKTITLAPRSYGGTCNPSAATHLAHGYKLVRPDAPPPAEEGHYVRFACYDEDAATIWRVYEQVPIPPPPPRVFDKYRLVDALITAGVWNHVEAWLKETPNAWTRALMAPDISEDEQLLKDGIDEMKKLLGWTDEQVEALLAKCVKE